MSKVAADTAAAFSATLVDEWVRGGVRHAVICPGSRSTPVALALVRHGGLEVAVRLDERGAGFFALGLALATGRPSIVLTTSGTAAAELHAAVVEAHHAQVPLIVCTADRPPELLGVGAPQTIDQAHLYGRAVRWFGDLGVPDEAGRDSWRSFASRALLESVCSPLGPGPVHLNLPFREPLIGRPGDLPPGRPGARPWHSVARDGRLMGGDEALDPYPPGPGEPHLTATSGAELTDFEGLVRPGARGIVVAGDLGRLGPDPVRRFAGSLGWPLLADPSSGCRLDDEGVIASADALLRSERFAGEMTPEVVLRIGRPWASKVLATWLSRTAAEGAIHLALEPEWAWKDPARAAAVIARHLPHVQKGGTAVSDGWLRRWCEAEAAAQSAIDEVLGQHGEITEPDVARRLFAHVPAGGCVVVSSSMPVREMEWFARPRPAPPRVLANRGANGIDGVVSTTLGVAASGTFAAGSVYGLLGDLAVLHDASALVRPASGVPATGAVLVVLDNDGGGIFDFLPQASELDGEEFERLFSTPQRPTVADLARGCGYEVGEIDEACDLPRALAAAARSASAGAPSFVVARCDRVANVRLHAEIHAAVAASLA